MKRVIKWICIICGVNLILGFVLVLIGIKIGGTPKFTINLSNHSVNSAANESFVSDEFDLDSFSEIEAYTSSVDFIVEKGDGYKVEYSVRESHVPQIFVSDNKLELKVENVAEIGFMYTEENREYIKITVPDNHDVYTLDVESAAGDTEFNGINVKGYLKSSSGSVSVINNDAGEDISIEISSGYACLEDSFVGNLKIKATSGDYHLSNVEASNIDYESSSGLLELKDIVADKIVTDILSGEIEASNVKCDTFEHSASSGSFEGDCIAVINFSADITSGDIKVTNFTVDNLTSESSSGDVKYVINGNQDDYGFTLHATSGDISCGDLDFDRKISIDLDKDKQISVEMTSGNTEIEFE